VIETKPSDDRGKSSGRFERTTGHPMQITICGAESGVRNLSVMAAHAAAIARQTARLAIR
jgi:hypothetical protein